MSSLERFGDRDTRIGNPERTALTDILRSSVDQGYIDLDEYEKRVDVLLAAKTVGDAEVVLSDLPAYHQIIDAQEPVKSGTPDWVKWLWFGFSIPIGINLGVWLVLFFTIGAVYFWPAWVIVPLVVVATSLTFAERKIIRPAEDRKRQERLRRKRNQRKGL
ncbi:DUF1707 SHOCT-like domain-containing protein [Glycomyces harbinensis]|uniref:DUF1707 domain-containing protein n=1 Tax=Glycomyces harbinensis TaxID=58114 RepID=A0A1G7D3Z5_9ACTN|nr:DUF1707 domain-containing protein [Glycomyces harbinensis]SDE45455.1 protein of unknown function [Glycomyces harbinensis]